MILIRDLCLQYGERMIFDNADLSLDRGCAVGLVGRNGAGKSTLLKIIATKGGNDSGRIEQERGTKIAYLPQEMTLLSTCSVLEETMNVFDELVAMQKELAQIDQKLMDGDVTDEILERYAELHEKLGECDLEAKKVEVIKVLEGLGFDEAKRSQLVSELSIGWRMRVVLAKLLLADADLYLFDEPTNHLDIAAKAWFLNFLTTSAKGYVLVSHDRYFLDNACRSIVEVERGNLTVYNGNFSNYVKQKEIAREKSVQAAKVQQREIERKKELIGKFRAKASKASFAQNLVKQLDRMELVEVEPPLPSMKFRFAEVERCTDWPLKVSHLSAGYDGKVLFKNVTFDVARGEKVALVAPNGCGKSTLMDVIAGKKDPSSGSVLFGNKVSVAYFEQEQLRVLDPAKNILQEVMSNCPKANESEVRAMLGSFLFPGDDALKRIAVLSGGERNRVAMVKVLLQRSNFLLLDEPTNHLDLAAQSLLVQALSQYQGTMLLVSHDQDFLNNVVKRILELTPSGIRDYNGNYDAYLWHKKQEEKPAQEILGVSKKTEKPVKESPGKNERGAFNKAEGRDRRSPGQLEKLIVQAEEVLDKLCKEIEAVGGNREKLAKLQEELKVAQARLDELEREWEASLALKK